MYPQNQARRDSKSTSYQKGVFLYPFSVYIHIQYKTQKGALSWQKEKRLSAPANALPADAAWKSVRETPSLSRRASMHKLTANYASDAENVQKSALQVLSDWRWPNHEPKKEMVWLPVDCLSHIPDPGILQHPLCVAGTSLLFYTAPHCGCKGK